MFNDVLTLITYSVDPDGIGNQKKVRTEKNILCNVQSTTRNEFYNYGDSELRPEYVAEVNACEYENEHEALFKNEQYVIERVYQVNRDMLELTLSRRLQR